MAEAGAGEAAGAGPQSKPKKEPPPRIIIKNKYYVILPDDLVRPAVKLTREEAFAAVYKYQDDLKTGRVKKLGKPGSDDKKEHGEEGGKKESKAGVMKADESKRVGSDVLKSQSEKAGKDEGDSAAEGRLLALSDWSEDLLTHSKDEAVLVGA